MKKSILIIMTLFSLSSFSQKSESVFSVYEKYINDCNEIVSDTIIQHGSVVMEYKSFKMKGNDCLMLVPTDTIWTETLCKEFKFEDFYNNNIFTISNYTQNTSSNFIYGSSKLSQVSENITRNKICKIKKRKPTFDDFWNRWCKENNYINF